MRVFLREVGNKMMLELQDRQRRTYVSAGAFVNGTGALKEPVFAPAYAGAAAQPRRRQQPAQSSPNPTASRRYYAKPQRAPVQVQTVRPAPPARFSLGMIVAISLTVVLVTMGFMWLCQLSEYTDVQYDVAKAQSDLTTHKETNRILSQQLEVLKDGERIRTYAVNKLGMIAPGKGEERTIAITLPRTQEPVMQTQEEQHYTLLDVLIDLI